MLYVKQLVWRRESFIMMLIIVGFFTYLMLASCVGFDNILSDYANGKVVKLK